MKWFVSVLAVALAFAWALSPGYASAQEPRDPLITPQSGEKGSRFQIVGQAGWVPGESVTVRLGFTTRDPLNFPGPFPFDEQVTVLRDGTWSFPIVLTDDLGLPLGDTPGFIVIRAEAASQIAVNVFVYTVEGRRPAGAEVIAELGFGPGFKNAALPLTAALFALGVGAMLLVSGAWRRRETFELGG